MPGQDLVDEHAAAARGRLSVGQFWPGPVVGMLEPRSGGASRDEDARLAGWQKTARTGDEVYSRVTVTDVSWFQQEPALSMELITGVATGPDCPIIDVGGGASVLIDRLLDAGYRDVSVLDLADNALTTARSRLGQRASRIDWIVANVLSWQPRRRYQVWHDRAVFHFLTEQADRERYRSVLQTALAPGGHAVIGTFAADGPTRCSGLPTARYSADDLAAQFPDYRVAHKEREQHVTPSGNVQPFTWLVLTKPPTTK